MPEINQVNADIKNYLDTLNISIQVSLDGFSFCIYSTEDKNIHAVRHYRFVQAILQEDIFNITDEILYKDDLLRLSFKKVRVIYTGRKSTLVPDEFFKNENLKSILEFNQPIDELDEIYYNTISGCQSKLVFTVPHYFTNIITDKFSNAGFYNQATPLLNYILSDEEKLQKDQVIVQLNRDFFDLIIVREGRLKLYNTFLFVNATDLVYFILYVCKQIKIDLKTSPIYILGGLEAHESLMQEITPYLPSMQLFKIPEHFRQGSVLKKIDIDRFFTLLYLSMCE